MPPQEHTLDGPSGDGGQPHGGVRQSVLPAFDLPAIESDPGKEFFHEGGVAELEAVSFLHQLDEGLDPFGVGEEMETDPVPAAGSLQALEVGERGVAVWVPLGAPVCRTGATSLALKGPFPLEHANVNRTDRT